MRWAKGLTQAWAVAVPQVGRTAQAYGKAVAIRLVDGNETRPVARQGGTNGGFSDRYSGGCCRYWTDRSDNGFTAGRYAAKSIILDRAEGLLSFPIKGDSPGAVLKEMSEFTGAD